MCFHKISCRISSSYQLLCSWRILISISISTLKTLTLSQLNRCETHSQSQRIICDAQQLPLFQRRTLNPCSSSWNSSIDIELSISEARHQLCSRFPPNSFFRFSWPPPAAFQHRLDVAGQEGCPPCPGSSSSRLRWCQLASRPRWWSFQSTSSQGFSFHHEDEGLNVESIPFGYCNPKDCLHPPAAYPVLDGDLLHFIRAAAIHSSVSPLR